MAVIGSGVTTHNEFNVDNINIDGNTISSTSGGITLTALAGQVVTIEGVTFDGGVVGSLGNLDVDGTITVGVDDTGYDVQFFGATAGAHLLWDESADTLKLVGGAATNMQGTLTVGVDATGYDVKFFGDTTKVLTPNFNA